MSAMHRCLTVPVSAPVAVRPAGSLTGFPACKSGARPQALDLAVPQLLEVRRAQNVCTRAVETKGAEAKPDASSSSSDSAPSSPEEEFYEVTLKKPLGFSFGRGNDGGTYVQRTDGKGSMDERIKAGDKVVQVSASFGPDVWDAGNYGQVLYAIKTRNGDVFLKLLDRKGDLSPFEEIKVDRDQADYYGERDGGNYGYSTKQWQNINYNAKKENEKKRVELFDGALAKFKKGEIEGALIDFEEVIALEPKNFMGEDFSRVTQIYRVAQYNIACCYSSINQADAGLDALKAALEAGFEQFGKVRNDSNLDNLRKSPRFDTLIDEYDEPVISKNAIKALKNIFSFGKGG